MFAFPTIFISIWFILSEIVEYGSVVQVQKRGEDEKHAAVVEAVGNECDLALLRVDSLFPPPIEENTPMEGVMNKTSSQTKKGDYESLTYALPLGPLPALQDEVEVLGYPMGGDSLCVTKGRNPRSVCFEIHLF